MERCESAHSDCSEQFFITNLVCVLQAAEQIKALYKLFLKVDATQVEINPFGETPDGKGLQHFRAKMLFYLEIVENGVLLNNVYLKNILFQTVSVVCFDAKFNFDDSAKFRQQEVFAMDDQSESDPREVEAGKYDLNYIGLDGNIACLGEDDSI